MSAISGVPGDLGQLNSYVLIVTSWSLLRCLGVCNLVKRMVWWEWENVPEMEEWICAAPVHWGGVHGKQQRWGKQDVPWDCRFIGLNSNVPTAERAPSLNDCYVRRLLDRFWQLKCTHLEWPSNSTALLHPSERCVHVRDYSGLFNSALFAEVAFWELPRYQ